MKKSKGNKQVKVKVFPLVKFGKSHPPKPGKLPCGHVERGQNR